MTRLLTIDPGLSTGVALGFYDDTTPYTLLERWNVLGGVPGFVQFIGEGHVASADQLVSESFVLRDNDFAADLVPVRVEGAILTLQALGSPHLPARVTAWQPPSDKGSLIGYPADCVSNTQRQRFRFDFLDRFGLFIPGTAQDDAHDAITHSIVFLRRKRHRPTLLKYWPPKGTR